MLPNSLFPADLVTFTEEIFCAYSKLPSRVILTKRYPGDSKKHNKIT